MRALHYFLFIVCFGQLHCSNDFSDLKVNELNRDFFKLEVDFLQQTIYESFFNVKLTEKFRKFGNKLNKQQIQEISHDSPILLNVWSWKLFVISLKRINRYYKQYRMFQKKQQQMKIPGPKEIWINYANDTAFSILSELNDINNILSVQNLFEDSLQELENDVCLLNISLHQVIYYLYNTIAITRLKVYEMAQFSFALLICYLNDVDHRNQLDRLRYEYKNNSLDLINKITTLQRLKNKEFWMCDPKIHTEGKTYIQVTKLFQGYIENIVNMNTGKSCEAKCARFENTTLFHCLPGTYCEKQKQCKGKIRQCEFVDSDMLVCPSNDNTLRRYKSILYKNGVQYGTEDDCKEKIAVDSWWNFIRHCIYCFCICDEEEIHSDRYINMQNVTANIANNKVITGLRFVKKNHIIHLQIQEGELLPEANIKQNSVKWKLPEKYNINDKNIQNGRDYHTLSWDEHFLNLDEITVPNGYVMTGVRFQKSKNSLQLEILASRFDFKSGILIEPLDSSKWIHNEKSERTNIPIPLPDIPTKSLYPSKPNFTPNSYITFTHTDLVKDAAQTTIPFIDAQQVAPQISTALEGAGLYYKGIDGFGGFVGVKVIVYDILNHLDINGKIFKNV